MKTSLFRTAAVGAFVFGLAFGVGSNARSGPGPGPSCQVTMCTTCSCCLVNGVLHFDGGDGPKPQCEHRCIPPGGCDPIP